MQLMDQGIRASEGAVELKEEVRVFTIKAKVTLELWVSCHKETSGQGKAEEKLVHVYIYSTGRHTEADSCGRQGGDPEGQSWSTVVSLETPNNDTKKHWQAAVITEIIILGLDLLSESEL